MPLEHRRNLEELRLIRMRHQNRGFGRHGQPLQCADPHEVFDRRKLTILNVQKQDVATPPVRTGCLQDSPGYEDELGYVDDELGG